MKRAVSINGITFNYPLFSSEEYEADDFIGSKTLNINGGYNIKLQEKGSLSKEVTLSSDENSWVGRDIKEALLKDVNLEEKKVIFDDASEENYYYDHSSQPIVFTPLYEGAEWYKVEINLLKR